MEVHLGGKTLMQSVQRPRLHSQTGQGLEMNGAFAVMQHDECI